MAEYLSEVIDFVEARGAMQVALDSDDAAPVQ
jgi:hypothetical protein